MLFLAIIPQKQKNSPATSAHLSRATQVTCAQSFPFEMHNLTKHHDMINNLLASFLSGFVHFSRNDEVGDKNIFPLSSPS